MAATPELEQTRWLERYSIPAFFLIAVGISTACAIFLDFQSRSNPLTLHFDECTWDSVTLRVVMYIQISSPSLAALVMIGQLSGRAGLQETLQSLFKWRIDRRNCVLLLSLPLSFIVPTVAQGLVEGESTLDLSQLKYVGASTWILLSLPGPGEELGWRGFLQPLVTRRFGNLASVIIIAALWWLWHVIPGICTMIGHSSQSIMPMLRPGLAVVIVPLTIILLRLYQRTSGNLLVVVIAHVTVNASIELCPRLIAANGLIMQYGPFFLLWLVGIIAYVSGHKK